MHCVVAQEVSPGHDGGHRCVYHVIHSRWLDAGVVDFIGET